MQNFLRQGGMQHPKLINTYKFTCRLQRAWNRQADVQPPKIIMYTNTNTGTFQYLRPELYFFPRFSLRIITLIVKTSVEYTAIYIVDFVQTTWLIFRLMEFRLELWCEIATLSVFRDKGFIAAHFGLLTLTGLAVGLPGHLRHWRSCLRVVTSEQELLSVCYIYFVAHQVLR